MIQEKTQRQRYANPGVPYHMVRGEKRTLEKDEAEKAEKTLKTEATGSKRRGVRDQRQPSREGYGDAK